MSVEGGGVAFFCFIYRNYFVYLLHLIVIGNAFGVDAVAILPLVEDRELLWVAACVAQGAVGHVPVGVAMSQVGLEAVWAAGFNFQPDFEALDVEDVVTFSWEPLDSFMFLEVLETNIATRQPQISISLQIYQGLYFSKVLIIRRQNLLDLRRQLMVMSQYALFILNIIHNSSLHQKDTIFV